MFQVQGSNGNMYTIRQSAQDGAWICSCPAWKFMKGKPGNARACKHIKKVAASMVPA
jgi:hypothetical protein